MWKEEYYKEVNLIFNQKIEQLEYELYHLLELDIINEKSIKNLEILINKSKEINLLKNLLYRLILREKKNIMLRILFIKLLFKHKEWKKVIKWSQKTLIHSNLNQKIILYLLLSKAFYKLNRPERSLQYLNFCLKIDRNYKPAIKIKKRIYNTSEYH